MTDAFRRLLNLARRTGDRLIITDPEGTDAFVVMDLDQYEALMTGSSRAASVPPVPVVVKVVDMPPPALSEVVADAQATIRPSSVPPSPILDEKKPEDEPGEEQFYLEPIE